jgi:hypothetical protein
MDPSDKLPGVGSSENKQASIEDSPLTSTRAGVVIALIGFAIFTIGAKPGWFGLGRGAGVGFVKISVFLFGLAVICVGGLIGMLSLWKGTQHTIMSDIGVRLVSTGYVISLFCGLADILGLGSQPPPQIPYFGPIQAAGVVVGQIVIAVGFLTLIPYHSIRIKK